MSKERRTVTLDKDLQDRLDDPSVNASGLVNQLLRSHFGENSERQRLEIRRDRLQDELDELMNAVETKREQLERVEAQLAEHTANLDGRLQTADNALPSRLVLERQFDAPPEEHQGVKSHAEKAGVEPAEFWDALCDYRANNTTQHTQHE